jgi:hypothetical protein
MWLFRWTASPEPALYRRCRKCMAMTPKWTGIALSPFIVVHIRYKHTELKAGQERAVSYDKFREHPRFA